MSKRDLLWHTWPPCDAGVPEAESDQSSLCQIHKGDKSVKKKKESLWHAEG
jgi:hypothetical protein